MQVLQEPGKVATSESYMWLYRSRRNGPEIICFEYKPSRKGEHPRMLFQVVGSRSSDVITKTEAGQPRSRGNPKRKSTLRTSCNSIKWDTKERSNSATI
nr:IS66 family transposase [Paenibacillus algicola]